MSEQTRPYGYVDEADYRALKAREERGVAAFMSGETDAREGRVPDPPEDSDERRMYRLGFFGPAKPVETPETRVGDEFEEFPF